MGGARALSGAATLELTILVHADRASVWDAIAVSDRRTRWWPHLELEARVGGRLLERWRDDADRERWTRGEVLGLEDGRRLRCSWRDDGWPAATEVEIALEPAEAETTRVALRHSGWEGLPDGAALRAAHARGWARHLANLKAVAEGSAAGG